MKFIDKTKAFIRDCFAPIVIAPPPPKAPMEITDGGFAAMGDESERVNPFQLRTPYPGVLPKNHTGMAMDSGISTAYAFAVQEGAFGEGVMAYSYAYLAELTQRAEYRRPSEILAKEMTRKWIRIQTTGEDVDKTEKIQKIQEELVRIGAQEIFSKAEELDGEFGRAHIYIDVGVDIDDTEELKVPLRLSPTKIAKNSLVGLKIVEPIWTYPNDYNSNDPLHPAFYKPQSWFVMGKSIHASRLMTIVGRPMPDLLKPAYQFGGLALTQMMKPYVDNWLRTRQSVSDLIHSFSVSGLKTEMGQTLDMNGMQQLQRRIQVFNRHRDNRGMMIIDKDKEEFFNITTPLTTLDSLQAQSQEHMSSVSGIPLSILLGITPTGLNASSEGEVRTFYQWVEAQQKATLSEHITYLLKIIQMSLFGTIDEAITFMWEPLWSMSEKEAAEIDKMEAETDSILVNDGVLDPVEVRKRIASKEDSPYHGLNVNDLPEPPENPADGEDLLKPEDDKKEAA